MNPKSKRALEAIRKKLAEETDPKRLSKQEYLDVIEELSADLEGAIEATREELEADEG